MRNLFLILFCELLYSCCIHKYEYKSDKMQVISQKGNSINRIQIESKEGEMLAQFDAIKDKPSKIFSLKSFSPEYFNCIEGCSFNFEKEKIYLIDVSPIGDRFLSPIRIKVKSDGSIEKVK